MAERRHRRQLPRPPRLRHGLSIIPSLFTVGNIFCGYFAVIATLRGNYDQAAIAIGLGAVLDGLDGRIARLTKTSSDFGVQLDSIADFGTFGIAPAMLAFSWGLEPVDGVTGNAVAQHLRSLGWLATFAFVICAGLRLARFNIQTQKPPESATRRYFLGLPTPPAALLIASIVHFVEGFNLPAQVMTVLLPWVFFFVVLATAFLMISTVRYYSFKELDIMKRGVRVMLFWTAMLIGLIRFYSEVVLLILAVVYVASGPATKTVQLLRRLLPSSVTHRETAHGNIKT
jgi:CDP-diacylglycerol--serine O-phosphatidyltransferase